jgi:hypothetical protein
MAEAQPDLQADSSWLAVPFLDRLPDARAIHLVRHPQLVIPSLLKIRLFEDVPPREIRPYAAFAYRHLPSCAPENWSTALERATQFYIGWNEAITKRRPDARIVRVEDAPDGILRAAEIEAHGDLYDNDHANTAGYTAPLMLEELPDMMRADLLALMEEYGYGPLEAQPWEARQVQVYWSVLLERNVHWRPASSLFRVAGNAALNGYNQIEMPYARTDDARNQIVKNFLMHSQHPDDTLVMLDNDHDHPENVVTELARRPEGVVAALAFRRSPPHDPLWFVRQDDGTLRQPAEWEEGLVYECDAVGTGAIAIKRRVFDALRDHGYRWPWFRYEYPDDRDGLMPSEDMYFCRICEESGIKVHVHTGVEIPHLFMTAADHKRWRRHLEDEEE